MKNKELTLFASTPDPSWEYLDLWYAARQLEGCLIRVAALLNSEQAETSKAEVYLQYCKLLEDMEEPIARAIERSYQTKAKLLFKK